MQGVCDYGQHYQNLVCSPLACKLATQYNRMASEGYIERSTSAHLGHKGEPGAQIKQADRRYVDAVQEDAATSGLQDAEERHHQRRFATARSTAHAHLHRHSCLILFYHRLPGTPGSHTDDQVVPILVLCGQFSQHIRKGRLQDRG